MKTELTELLQEWIQKEAESSEDALAHGRRSVEKKIPLYMGGSVGVMLLIGILVGAGSKIFVIHLPIGLAFGLFCVLFLKLQQKSLTNPQVLVKVYQRGAQEHFKMRPESDQMLFLNQMSARRYDTCEYLEKMMEVPSKVIVGPDYIVYRNGGASNFLKVSETQKLVFATTTASTSYQTSGSKVHKTIATGVEIRAVYDASSPRKSLSPEAVMYFNNLEQAAETVALIKKHCPEIAKEL